MMLLVVALLAAQVDAGPADAGPPPSVCGALTDEGACFNDLAAYCSEENSGGEAAAADVLVEDCAGGACELISGLGAWCYAADGAACAFEAGERATSHACGPVGAVPEPGWGCDLVEGCVAIVPGGCADGCTDGARLHLGCATFGQPVLFSCAAFGGACQGDSCTGLGAGSPCSERLRCADGLSCVVGSCASATPGLAIDAGPPEPAPSPAPPPLCGTGVGASVVALAVLAASRRWPRRRRDQRPCGHA